MAYEGIEHIRYDDLVSIRNYNTSFNRLNSKDIPDLRSLKYITSTDHLNCPICQQPFIDPLTTICGHTFCRDCILEYLKSLSNARGSISGNNTSTSSGNNGNNTGITSTGYCPLDRTPIDAANINDLFPTPLIVTNLIDDLKVLCFNSERGCEWRGSRWEVEHHVMEDCGYTGVKCGGKRIVYSIAEDDVEEENGNEEMKEDYEAEKEKEKEKDEDYDDEEEKEEEENEEENQGLEELESTEPLTTTKEPEDSNISIMADKTQSRKIIEKEEVCLLVVERRFLSGIEHQECIHRIFQCEFCDTELTKLTRQMHLEQECLHNYKTCELCGNDSIAEKNMAKHQENCIKMGKIKCPAHEIGCKWIGSNETALEIHLQNGNCQLNQFLPYHNKTMERLSSLELENQFLQRQLHKILDSIIQGKVSNLGYNDNLEEINKFQDSVENQDKLMYLNFEVDRLKFEINEKLIPFMNKYGLSMRYDQDNSNTTLMKNLINDNFMMREDMNVQRMMINSLRKQLQFMLFARNQKMGLAGNMMNMHNLGSDDMMPGDFYDAVSRSSSEERLNLKL